MMLLSKERFTISRSLGPSPGTAVFTIQKTLVRELADQGFFRVRCVILLALFQRARLPVALRGRYHVSMFHLCSILLFLFLLELYRYIDTVPLLHHRT